MQAPVRVLSIDIMRGFTLCLMLFVNDLFVPGVPSWMLHTEAQYDGMGLADWVFPGFLFMVGISIPFAIESRKKKGDATGKITSHILIRSFSLILIGILIYNGSRINPELTGMPRLLWLALLYISIFLVWNYYPKSSGQNEIYKILQVIGLLGIISLAIIFRAGNKEHVEWLETGWWGILGLIGWGYLTAALIYLLTSDKIFPALAAWIFFILLNILTQAHILQFSGIPEKIFGIVLSGNVPSLVLAGLTTGIIIKKYSVDKKKLVILFFLMGIACIALGFFLRQWFILSKIIATPSWAMLCNGISLLVLAIVYYLVDILRLKKWSGLFSIAGKNSLTTYLAPDIIYFACWGLNIPLFFYKQDHNMMLAVAGSVIWSLLMILFAQGLSKIGIRLKL
ncbi:MAG: DUF5009 domain-containing protein [Bacteroidetes bacterium]|nr:DUF5009 domain-containing protein [Bacteroidota bacterium]MBS1631664.1 DUF5009 domain-containing protein [Bacteroidota bacterium]